MASTGEEGDPAMFNVEKLILFAKTLANRPIPCSPIQRSSIYIFIATLAYRR